jgi:ribosomal protein S18 acetylase RimI-like enzyme
MDIRRITELDSKTYWQTRLEAMEREPQAFTESPADHKAMSVETIRKRLSSSEDNFVLGAFEDGQLIGTVGFARRTEAKTSHRGLIWGVYVASEGRGKGVGRALLAEMIRLLRSRPGLEQVALGVSTTNVAAKRLYESLGFEIYGRENRALKIGDEYVDEELMVLYFSSPG